MAVVAVGGYGRAELAPAFRRRPAVPASVQAHRAQRADDRVPALPPVGSRPQGRPGDALGRRLRAHRPHRPGDLHQSARGALPVGRRRPVRRVRASASSARWSAAAAPLFVEAKLAERDARHQRTGDSRYLLEPNVKEGKGGLRDLQTLFWLGRFLYRIERPEELVAHGVLDPCGAAPVHQGAAIPLGRALPSALPDRSRRRSASPSTCSRRSRSAWATAIAARRARVERFMKHYYLIAKEVGALTRIFCAALEEQHRRRPRLGPRAGSASAGAGSTAW